MCAEKKTCACRHAAAAGKTRPLDEAGAFACPMTRGEKPPPLGPDTKCDKLEQEPE